jgi:hypothetical protein
MKKVFCAIMVLLVTRGEAASLCSQDEGLLFSCDAANGKSISLCASPEAESGRGYMHYLYGTPSRIEINFPRRDRYNNRTFSGSYSYGPGFISYIAFHVASYSYYVYSAHGDDVYATNGLKMANFFDSNGVVVFKGLREVAHIKCQAESATPMSEDTFKRYSLPAADEATEQLFDKSDALD